MADGRADDTEGESGSEVADGSEVAVEAGSGDGRDLAALQVRPPSREATGSAPGSSKKTVIASSSTETAVVAVEPHPPGPAVAVTAIRATGTMMSVRACRTACSDRQRRQTSQAAPRAGRASRSVGSASTWEGGQRRPGLGGQGGAGLGGLDHGEADAGGEDGGRDGQAGQGQQRRGDHQAGEVAELAGDRAGPQALEQVVVDQQQEGGGDGRGVCEPGQGRTGRTLHVRGTGCLIAGWTAHRAAGFGPGASCDEAVSDTVPASFRALRLMLP
nr:hypothetical protein GCM10020093_077230 [Planobispora longispora]